MVSLSIFAGIFLISVILNAAVLALSARAVGSPRGRFRVALLALLLTFCINIGFTLLAAQIPTAEAFPPPLRIGILVVLIVVQLLTLVRMFSGVFRLSFGRAFVPLLAQLALSAALVVFALNVMKPHLLEGYVVPNHAMMPTIDPGDRLLVSKIIQPRRWDLMAHWSNEEVREVFCQRLIAFPGERLRFDQGGIFINDQPMTVPAVLTGHCRAFIPNMPNPRYQDGQTIVLGNDEYFFLGDNIDISGDSRIYGPTKRPDLIGVVDVKYWPLGKFRIIR